jgi:hypothetical protein
MMEATKCQNEFSVGVKEINSQHLSLLETINILLEDQRYKYKISRFLPALFSRI